MGAIASQITGLTSVYSTVYSGIEQRKHQSSASLTFVRGIHRRPVNSLHKWPVTRKMFPFDDVIMIMWNLRYQNNIRTRVFIPLRGGPKFVNPSWLWFQIPRFKTAGYDHNCSSCHLGWQACQGTNKHIAECWQGRFLRNESSLERISFHDWCLNWCFFNLMACFNLNFARIHCSFYKQDPIFSTHTFNGFSMKMLLFALPYLGKASVALTAVQ